MQHIRQINQEKKFSSINEITGPNSINQQCKNLLI